MLHNLYELKQKLIRQLNSETDELKVRTLLKRLRSVNHLIRNKVAYEK